MNKTKHKQDARANLRTHPRLLFILRLLHHVIRKEEKTRKEKGKKMVVKLHLHTGNREVSWLPNPVSTRIHMQRERERTRQRWNTGVEVFQQ